MIDIKNVTMDNVIDITERLKYRRIAEKATDDVLSETEFDSVNPETSKPALPEYEKIDLIYGADRDLWIELDKTDRSLKRIQQIMESTVITRFYKDEI